MTHSPAGWGIFRSGPSTAEFQEPLTQRASPGSLGSPAPRAQATGTPRRALSPRPSTWAAGLVLFGALLGSPAPHGPTLGDQRASKTEPCPHTRPLCLDRGHPASTGHRPQGLGSRATGGWRRAALSTTGRAARAQEPAAPPAGRRSWRGGQDGAGHSSWSLGPLGAAWCGHPLGDDGPHRCAPAPGSPTLVTAVKEAVLKRAITPLPLLGPTHGGLVPTCEKSSGPPGTQLEPTETVLPGAQLADVGGLKGIHRSSRQTAQPAVYRHRSLLF